MFDNQSIGPEQHGIKVVLKIDVSPLNPRGIGFQKFQIGDIEIYQIFDGEGSRELDAAAFRNVGPDEVQRSLEDAGFPIGVMPNSYTVTIARVGGELVMFDAGNGEGGQPKSGKLQDNMIAAGLDPHNISRIVVTHFHPDHIFGLMTKANEQVYPDAEIFVPSAEYEFWINSECLDYLPPARVALARRVQATFTHWPNIRHYAADCDVLPGIRAVPTYGHSPGHTSLLLHSGDTQVLVTADVTNIAALNLLHPDWHLAADYDPPLAVETRRRVLDRLAAEGMICTGYHWGMPGIGRIIKKGEGFALEPLSAD